MTDRTVLDAASDSWPLIVQVRRGSQHDGPGIRSVVFFKGCHLRCGFCQNPEAQAPWQEIASQAARCVRCGNCVAACPNGALEPELDARIERSKCERCGACTRVCPAGALTLIGARYTPSALGKLLSRDAAYYHHSGGGVTLSGGECLLYPAYIARLLDSLEVPTPMLPRGVSVAIQTGGEFDFDSACSILRRVDYVQFDLKFADPAEHLAHTGHSNERIIRNLHRLLELDATKVEVRVPLIPGITTTDDNFRGLARVLHRAEVAQVSLLPYNPMGPASAHALGRTEPQLPATFLSLAEHSALVSRFQAILAESGSARLTAQSYLSLSGPGRCVNRSADRSRPASEEKSGTDRSRSHRP